MSVAERALVVGQPRAVRRPDLDQPRARLGDHVRHAEAAADLDQLPARDDDLAARPGQRRGRQQRRARAVVDREARLGAGQLAQQRLDVRVPRAARAGRQVQLEVRVARGRRATASRAAAASGARPRFVCTITPVALSTRRSDGRADAAAHARARAPRSTSSVRAREQLGAPLGEHRPRRRDAPAAAARRPARPAHRPAAGRADAHRRAA